MNAPLARPLVFHPPGDDRLARRLRTAVQGEVRFDRAARGRYSTDASIYQIEPIGVLIPRSHDDVRAAVDVCRELGVPMLPRGGGSSQCGQTVGAALVIDHSKYLRGVVGFDRDAMTVTVEPGIVLDALNAWLRPHGVWFPVDVSTSAQATIGGMTGNNSCGSRSIAYGNMVHNVVAADALLADGTEAWLGDERLMGGASPRVRALMDGLRAIADRERDEIERQVPKVMRRVGGYNLDVFHPQSERPYTADGGVNYAHLLVGSEGTLAWTRTLTLKLAPLPTHKTLGVVSFPTLYKAMELTKHIVTLAPSAVELVDRTMIDLARGNPSFRPVIDAALVGEPDAILLVEFVGEEAEAPRRKLDDLVALMADLGLPGQVVPMTEANPQKALWDVRKAGLNVMMSMKGDGKPVSASSRTARCRWSISPITSPALNEIFARHGTHGTFYAHASVGTLHVQAYPRHAQGWPRRGRSEDARDCRGEPPNWCASTRARTAASTEMACVRGEWIEWQFGPAPERCLPSHQAAHGSGRPDESGQDRRPAGAWTTCRSSAIRRRRSPMSCALRHVARLVGVGRAERSADGQPCRPRARAAIPRSGFAKAVEMCNNNGHCRKFDVGTMCPSFRVTRDEEHLTRGRANTLRLALSGQLGPDFANEAVREALDLCVSCKGLQARLPDRRRHGEDEDRIRLALAAEARAVAEGPPGGLHAEVGAVGGALPVHREPPRHLARRGQAIGEDRRPLGTAQAAALAQRPVPGQPRREGGSARQSGRRAAGRHVQQLQRTGERARRAAGAAGRRLPGGRRTRRRRRRRARPAAVLRPHLPGRRPGR
jgi:FAD/FMN-containing dehydrogenase